jgi:hypothetical protein
MAYGSNLTAAGIHAVPQALTLPGGTEGIRNAFLVDDTAQLNNVTAKGSYIVEAVVNVTAPTTQAGIFGNTVDSGGSFGVRMDPDGTVFIRHKGTDGSTNDSAFTASGHAGIEKSFVFVYNGVGGWIKLFVDGVEEISLDISSVPRGPIALEGFGYGCIYTSTSDRTPAMTIRRMGFMAWPASIDVRWRGIVQAMNAAKAGDEPIQYRT